MFLNFHMPTNTSKASFFLFDLCFYDTFLWNKVYKNFFCFLYDYSHDLYFIFFESFLFLIQYPNRYWDFLALSVCGKMAVFYVTFLNVVFVYVCILFFPNWLSYSSAKLLLYSSKLTPNKPAIQKRNTKTQVFSHGLHCSNQYLPLSWNLGNNLNFSFVM